MALKKISQNKSLLESLFGSAADMGAKLIDEQDWFKHDNLIEKIPYGKIAVWIATKYIEIADIDKAFNQAYALAYFLCFSQAVKRYKVELREIEKITDNAGSKNEVLFKFAETQWEETTDTTEIFSVYTKKYKTLLEDCCVSAPQANTVMNYIKGNLRICFYELLEDQRITYKKLNEEINKKSYALVKENLKIIRYNQEQRNLYLSPVMGDEQGMTLKDVYIEPEYRIHKQCLENDSIKKHFENNDESDFESDHQNVFLKPKEKKDMYINIHAFLNDFIQSNKIKTSIKSPKSNTLILLGYPGQGKTSCIRRVLFDLLQYVENPTRPVFHLPLRTIENVKDFINSPFEIIKEYIQNLELPKEYTTRILNEGLIILEGLDELAIQSGTKDRTIDEVVKEIIRIQENHPDLKIILTSRFGYIDCDLLKKKNALILQLHEMTVDKQIEWLGKYKKFYPNCKTTSDDLQTYNEEDNHLHELINQPILLHMIVSSELNVTEGMNRAKLYEQLFNILIDRKWAKGGQISILEKLEPEDLRDIIRGIALAIFQTGRNCIQKKELEGLEEVQRNIIQKLGYDNLGGALKGVMVSFYFQEVEQNNEKGEVDYGIEFLHKSLSEYMAAEKIWKEIKFFTEYSNIKRHFSIDNTKDALELLNRLFAQRLLTYEVRNYLLEIIDNDTKIDFDLLTDRLSFFLSSLLEKNFLWDYNPEKHQEPIKRALHTFYGFWTVLSKLAAITERNLIQTSFSDSFIFNLKSCLLLNPPSFSLAYQNFSGVDFSGLDLSDCYFNRSIFTDASFYQCCLSFTNFTETTLNNSLFESANINNADFNKANLSSAYFNDTKIINTNFQEVKAHNTNFQGAVLNNVNFKNAELINTNLICTKIVFSDFQMADLDGTDLSGAILEEVNLEDANLNGVVLDKATLVDLNFENTIFNNTSLESIKIDKKTFANLQKNGIELPKFKIIKTHPAVLNFTDDVPF